MDEMKLLEDFCAAEPPPGPPRLAHVRSELIEVIARQGSAGAGRSALRPWARISRRTRQQDTAPGPRAGRSWPAWLIPVAVAAAVAAIAVAIPAGLGALGHGTGPAAPHGPSGPATIYILHNGISARGQRLPVGSIVPVSTATNTAGNPIRFKGGVGAAAITPDGKTIYAPAGLADG